MGNIKLLVINNSEIFREGLSKMLVRLKDIEIAGACSNTLEAIEKLSILQPDVVLMDTKPPDTEWIDATKRIRELLPKVKVLVLTNPWETCNIPSALQAGVRGFVSKYTTIAGLVRAIKLVVDNELILSPDMAKTLLDEFRVSVAPTQLKGANQEMMLSKRERDVLSLVAEGASNKEIAVKLLIAENTVKVHLRSIMVKLNVHSRYKVARIAAEKGMTS